MYAVVNREKRGQYPPATPKVKKSGSNPVTQQFEYNPGGNKVRVLVNNILTD